MKCFALAAALLTALATRAQVAPAPGQPEEGVGQPSPRQLYPGLFEAVQLARVYPDGKTFVDATATAPPAEILAAYERSRTQPGFQLKSFVDQYFTPPTAATDSYHSNIAAGIRPHLDTLWTVLRRPAQPQVAPGSSLLPLPRPYLVPGGRFREMYYWDSYFTMLGLAQAGRTAALRDMVADFASLLDRYGHIPNGTRTYYLSRSQPPFFALMVQLLVQAEGPASRAYTQYRPQLEREYAYWTLSGAAALPRGTAQGRVVIMPGGEKLSRYWDDSDQPREESYREDVEAAKTSAQPPAEFYHNVRAAAASGWDFSAARWFVPGQGLGSIRTTRFVPVDLNCLLLTLEQTLALAARQNGDSTDARQCRRLAQARAAAIQRYCWDAQAGFFADYDLDARRPSPARTLAAVFPLAYGVATPAQGAQVARVLQAEFLRPGGLLTTPGPVGQQWDAPNGWAPLQYLAVQGLRRTRQPALADTVARRWVRTCLRGFQQTGKLLEKYNVEATGPAAGGGGEYPLQDGFGWTNGVLLTLLNERARPTNPAPVAPALPARSPVPARSTNRPAGRK